MISPVVLYSLATSGIAGKNAKEDKGDKNPDTAAMKMQIFFVLILNLSVLESLFSPFSLAL